MDKLQEAKALSEGIKQTKPFKNSIPVCVDEKTQRFENKNIADIKLKVLGEYNTLQTHLERTLDENLLLKVQIKQHNERINELETVVKLLREAVLEIDEKENSKGELNI
jgi:hypothetical protein